MAESRREAQAAAAEQPLELILARNLVSIVSLAAFLFDAEERLVFYNDAAANLVGKRFEEVGTMTREQVTAELGPLDKRGRELPVDEVPLAVALRESRPAYGRFFIHSDRGLVPVEAGALPLVGPSGLHGAMVVFWVPEDDGR